MRESAGGTFSEIDSFTIPLTFPPGVQEVRFVGEDEVAAIILSADVVCIEPDICCPSLTPSEVSSGETICNDKSRLGLSCIVGECAERSNIMQKNTVI